VGCLFDVSCEGEGDGVVCGVMCGVMCACVGGGEEAMLRLVCK